jgi:hypothetical protein
MIAGISNGELHLRRKIFVHGEDDVSEYFAIVKKGPEPQDFAVHVMMAPSFTPQSQCPTRLAAAHIDNASQLAGTGAPQVMNKAFVGRDANAALMIRADPSRAVAPTQPAASKRAKTEKSTGKGSASRVPAENKGAAPPTPATVRLRPPQRQFCPSFMRGSGGAPPPAGRARLAIHSPTMDDCRPQRSRRWSVTCTYKILRHFVTLGADGRMPLTRGSDRGTL